jgi:hypothetical protein
MIICVVNFCYFVGFLKFGWKYLKFYNTNFFPHLYVTWKNVGQT